MKVLRLLILIALVLLLLSCVAQLVPTEQMVFFYNVKVINIIKNPPIVYFNNDMALTVSAEDIVRFGIGYHYNVRAHLEGGIWVIDYLRNLSVYEV